MRTSRKLALLVAGATALQWPTPANAQGGFGGGPTTAATANPVVTPVSNTMGGAPFGNPTNTNPFGGGIPGFGGAPGGNQFRGGFNGSWLAAQISPNGNSNHTSPAGSPSVSQGVPAPGAFSAYYVNPLAAGAPGVSSLAPINASIYSAGPPGLQGGPYPVASTPSNGRPDAPGNGPGRAAGRSPPYMASPAFDDRPAETDLIKREVERVLAGSMSLSPQRNIRVVVENSAIILRGTVASETDRRLAEALVRLSPGVYQVRNELKVAPRIRWLGITP